MVKDNSTLLKEKLVSEKDNGAWWVENGELHLDIPRLLKNCELPDTEENRDRAVNLVLEVAADELPPKGVIVVRRAEND